MTSAETALQWPAIARLAPLSRLGPESLREVQRTAHIGELEPGQELFRKGSADRFDFYLVDGTVDLVGSDAGATSVTATRDGALQIVDTVRPRPATARARTRVQFLRLDAGILDMLTAGGGEAGYTVEEYRPDDEALEGRLLFDIYQAYAEDRLEIPAVPELAARIRRAVDDPANGAAEITRVVQADPAVAARLVQVANSALYASASPVRNLREAVVRIGLRATRDLVVSFTVQNLFKTDDAALRRSLLEVWRHSTLVGAISFTLARCVGAIDPEHALLAGLLHDIGAAMLVTHAERWPELGGDRSRLAGVVAKLRGEVGALVLMRWNFPDDMVHVAREAESWWREHPGPPDVCDVVMLAQLYAYQSSGTRPADLPAMEGLPAYAGLGLAELQARHGNCVLDEAQKEVAEMRRLLLA
jgi:HD-like signal output (HDOD) protein